MDFGCAYMRVLFSIAVCLGACALDADFAAAQTDIYISGAKAGFPIALPILCDAGGAGDYTRSIPRVITQDLLISGVFKILNPSTFVETPGKCSGPDEVAYSDWSVIGAEGLVRGEVGREPITSRIVVKLYLHDVLRQKAVVGKQFTARGEDYERIAHKFSNAILGFFTGRKGIFGSKIAYVSKVGRFKELFLMDLNGDKQRQLTHDKGLVVSPSWSPGGDRILYTSYRTRSPELYAIEPNGGAPVRLTHRDGLEVGAEYSPSGKTLIASLSFSGISKIALLDLRGKVLRRLTTSGALDVSPSFSPDGSEFAFCSNRGGGPQIYVQSIKGGTPRRISFTGSNYCTSPAWSPRGDNIAFVCRSSGNQIFAVSPSGGEAVQLTFGGINEDPAWSPDGRFIAFSSNFASSHVKNIAIMSLLGGSTKQITFGKSESSQPSWSPVID